MSNELTQEQRERVVAWLQEKQAANAVCPMCGNNSWGIGSTLVLQPTYSPGVLMLGAGYPAVIIHCNRCAYIRLHNAIVMGIVESEKGKAQAPATEEVKHG